MKNTIITVYPNFTNRIDINIEDDWNLLCILNVIKLLLTSKDNLLNHKIITISKKYIPGNRFRLIGFLNDKIYEYSYAFLLRLILARFNTLSILWIKNPFYFRFHNYAKFKNLVFSCNDDILKNNKVKFFYKDFFRKGWVFTYSFMSSDKAFVLKNLPESKIVSFLKNQG
jgi:hypothetical protein